MVSSRPKTIAIFGDVMWTNQLWNSIKSMGIWEIHGKSMGYPWEIHDTSWSSSRRHTPGQGSSFYPGTFPQPNEASSRSSMAKRRPIFRKQNQHVDIGDVWTFAAPYPQKDKKWVRIHGHFFYIS
jgi:hypothetical protein